MKKILLLSVAVSSLTFASSYTNAEKVLTDTFQTKFKCYIKKGCSGSNISFNKNGKSIKIRKVNILLGENFKLDYNRKEILINASKICGKDKNCLIKEAKISAFKSLSSLLTQSKKIGFHKVVMNDTINNKKIKIKNVSIDIDSALKNIDLNNLKTKDLLLNAKVKLTGIESNEARDMIKGISSILPESKKDQYNKELNKVEVKDNPSINDINDKFIVMYNEIFKKSNLSSISNLDMEIKTTEKNKVLMTTLNLIIDDSISGKSEIGINLKLRSATKRIREMSIMTELQLFMTLATNLIVDKVYFKNTQNYLFTKHNKILKKDTAYRNNYNELLSLIKNSEEELSFYNKFGYKLLSLQFQESSLTIKNKNEMQISQFLRMISTIENKDFFEIEESFK